MKQNKLKDAVVGWNHGGNCFVFSHWNISNKVRKTITAACLQLPSSRSRSCSNHGPPLRKSLTFFSSLLSCAKTALCDVRKDSAAAHLLAVAVGVYS